MHRITTFLIAALLSVILGCGSDEPRATPSQAASTPEAAGAAPPSVPSAHAGEGVVPGSYEDWCGAHGVPESLCTRCNPALIPAFKATGDWCAEHNLPESQCLACNPSLRIERPARPEGH